MLVLYSDGAYMLAECLDSSGSVLKGPRWESVLRSLRVPFKMLEFLSLLIHVSFSVKAYLLDYI
jgi:hypothetical protein